MTDDETGTLLTGGTGFLGGEVLVRLLERDDRPVYVLVRAESDERASARLDALLASLLGSAGPCSQRVIPIRGDVTQAWLGMGARSRDQLAERVGQIVHCAASVSFTMGLAESREINVEGTRRMIQLGELCDRRGALDSFVHVSTAYVAGTHTGSFTECDLDVGQDFRNPYERSKFEAERVIRERGWGLPVQVLRPSIVVGDSRTGWTPTFNVLYGPMKAFARGAYPAIPARRSAPVDVVPVNYVADAIVALAGRPGTTYHLTAGDRASSVGELIELGSSAASQRRPRVLPPRLYRRVIHPVLVRQGSESRRRALRRSEVYFPYFSMRTRFENFAAQEALEPLGIEVPPLSSYFDRLMGFATVADWGRRSVARHEVMPSTSISNPVSCSETSHRRVIALSMPILRSIGLRTGGPLLKKAGP
jgi:thioester reductase-like protein